MPQTVYAVTCGRGVVTVTVDASVITLRGEKRAVLEAAWRKLKGENNLGEVIQKRSPTRKFLMAEIMSRNVRWNHNEYGEMEAFDIFWDKADYRIKAAAY